MSATKKTKIAITSETIPEIVEELLSGEKGLTYKERSRNLVDLLEAILIQTEAQGLDFDTNMRTAKQYLEAQKKETEPETEVE
jgi:hypothetical protein